MKNSTFVALGLGTMVAVAVPAIALSITQLYEESIRIKTAKSHYEAAKLVNEAAHRADQMIIDEVFAKSIDQFRTPKDDDGAK